MEPRLGPNYQSHLCCCLDNTSLRPASTSTSAAASGCSIPSPDFEAVPVSPCLCPPRGLQTFTLKSVTSQGVLASAPLTFTHKSPHLSRRACNCTIDFHSQVSHLSRRACKCTIDFHSQVTSLLKTCFQVHHWLSLSSQSPLKMCLQVQHWLSLTSHWWLLTFWRLATVAWLSFRGAVILLLWAWYCHCVPWILCIEPPLWAWFRLWCSICSDTTQCDSGTGSHSTLSYLICGASSCLNELVLATRCHLNKINRVLFPLTVLRSLSFLIPSFTCLSSYPVVCLPLTYAWGLLEVCHRDGSLAVLFPLWLERLEALLEVVPSPYKSSSGFTTWVGSGPLSVLQADW